MLRYLHASASAASASFKSVSLPAGLYRLNIVAKDPIADKWGAYEIVLDVPRYRDDRLISSSLIIGDRIEKVPVKNLTSPAMFLIGDTNVRPRIGKFTSEEKIGIYIQFYNFGPDPITQKPSGTVQYELTEADSNRKILDFSEDIARLAHSSASEVTVEKLLPLKTLGPGRYTLRITALDRSQNQTVQQQGSFSVVAP